MISVSPPVKLTDYRWLNLFRVEYQTGSGHAGKWEFASRKQSPVLGSDPLVADAVVVVPIMVHEGKQCLLLNKEYRVPLGDYEYCFPAGLLDPEETVEEAAARELKEETGLILSKVLAISPPLISSAGLSDESVVMIFAECHGEPNTHGTEASEDIKLVIVDYDAMCQLRQSQVKISAKTWPVLFMFECLGKIDL